MSSGHAPENDGQPKILAGGAGIGVLATHPFGTGFYRLLFKT